MRNERRVRRIVVSSPRSALAALALGLGGASCALAADTPVPVVPAAPPAMIVAEAAPVPIFVDRDRTTTAAPTDTSITTGAVTPAGPIERRIPAGSGEFRRALDLITSGNAAQAYQMARGFTDNVERRTIQWAAIYFGKGDVDPYSIKRFEADAPDFASAGVYRTRLEQSLVKAAPGKDEVISLLGGHMPNTIDAQIALAAAYVKDGQVARAGRIIKSVWVHHYLDRATEEKVLKQFGGLLDRADHWQRSRLLLMNERASGVERIMDQLSPAQQSLAKAMIAVWRNKSDAKRLLDWVDPAYREDSLFYFAMAEYEQRQGNLQRAVAWLNKASGPLPDAAEWWYTRRTLARRLLAQGDAKTAYEAAAGYTHGPEGRLVDAHFHAGWIALDFLHDAKTAVRQFTAMRKLSTLAGSITQSEYWLGRAYAKLGQRDAANAHFADAAKYKTTYYGLLARKELGREGVPIHGLPAWRASVPAFEAREVVKAVHLLAENGQEHMAEPLVRHLAYAIKDPGQMVLLARLAQDIDAHNLAILIADIADRRNIPLDLFNFPKDGLPHSVKLAEIDKAAVYAVARQESHFNFDAVSRSGARGLMQLMPATAKETAHKIGVAYSTARLTRDPGYNALLGSTYLAHQLSRFDGSLLLAAAAYNAGGGNVSKWLARYGNPMARGIDPVSWVELIPFAETRKYVQRVLANYTVYKARLGDNTVTISDAMRPIR